MPERLSTIMGHGKPGAGYACHLFLGLLFVTAEMMEQLGYHLPDGVAFFVGLTFFPLTIIAFLIAMSFMIRQRQELALRVLGVMLLGVPVAMWLAAEFTPMDQGSAGWYILLYGVIALITALARLIFFWLKSRG